VNPDSILTLVSVIAGTASAFGSRLDHNAIKDRIARVDGSLLKEAQNFTQIMNQRFERALLDPSLRL